MIGEGFSSVLAAAQAGDDDAVAALYRDNVARVRGYVRAQGVADPDDVVSEVFVSMVRSLASFTGDEDDFRGWLFTIAHRRVVDERRRRGRRPETPVADDILRAAVGVGGDGEVEALERLRVAGVLDALDELTPDQRAVLLLRVVADLPVLEIARMLGKGEPAVKALLRRGVAAMERRRGDEE